MATVAGDVPGVYDLVVNVSGGNTTGFVFDDALESSLPFRTHKATYTYSPTFIERQNVQGDFGDNQQDFFLTATQKDWSLGEQQRYFRSTDDDAKRRFWTGSRIDITEPGQVSLRPDTNAPSITTPQAITATGSGVTSEVCVGGTTNLFTVNQQGTVTDKGAHGLGVAPATMEGDNDNLYLSSTSAGTVGVRRWTGAAFSTFSASGCDSLAYLNNTLYGYRHTAATGDLIRYDTAGAVTSIFTWKDGNGTISNVPTYLEPFGGKLLILRLSGGPGNAGELWLYDGTAPSKIAEFPQNFSPSDIIVAYGVVYISGLLREASGASVLYRGAVYYYAGGNTGLLWKATALAASTNFPGLASFNNGLVFNDDTSSTLIFYDLATGGVHRIAIWAPTQGGYYVRLASRESYFVACTLTNSYVRQYPGSGVASGGTIETSLFDYESYLKKLFRGITVEFDSATDGNGGSVDVAYRLEDVDGSYTSLATGVTSGTENTLSGISGKRISVKVTLNKGTSTNGPVLKRIYVRAAPILTRFEQREYILSCIGDPASEDRQILRDGMSSHPLAGRKQADQLVLAAASQSALTLTDRFGTYTGIIETLEIYEQHASNSNPSASGSFVAKVATREI